MFYWISFYFTSTLHTPSHLMLFTGMPFHCTFLSKSSTAVGTTKCWWFLAFIFYVSMKVSFPFIKFIALLTSITWKSLIRILKGHYNYSNINYCLVSISTVSCVAIACLCKWCLLEKKTFYCTDSKKSKSKEYSNVFKNKLNCNYVNYI